MTKEFIELVLMTDTATAADIFSFLGGALDRVSVDWARTVSLVTNGAPSMIGRKPGVAARFREKVRAANGGNSFWTNGDTMHFPCLRSVRATRIEIDTDRYKDKITELMWEFEQRFQVFCKHETEYTVFCSPFTVKASDLLVDIQPEVVDLQCDSDLKDKFASTGLDTFYQYLLPGYPKLTALVAKALCMFGATYPCEQAFSVMSISKTKLCARLTQKHLNDIMTTATDQDLMPDTDALVEAERCQVSGAS